MSSLARVDKLPDALARNGLWESRLALLFATGHEDTLRTEGSIPESETPETVQEFFEKWYAEGSEMELRSEPDFLLDDIVVLRSRVLGCTVHLDCANNLTSTGIGETVLGTLEALLATSLSPRMLPHLEMLRIRIAPSGTAGLTPTLTFADKKGETVGAIAHAPRLVYTTREEALAAMLIAGKGMAAPELANSLDGVLIEHRLASCYLAADLSARSLTFAIEFHGGLPD